MNFEAVLACPSAVNPEARNSDFAQEMVQLCTLTRGDHPWKTPYEKSLIAPHNRAIF
jgi:hypothetical protein